MVLLLFYSNQIQTKNKKKGKCSFLPPLKTTGREGNKVLILMTALSFKATTKKENLNINLSWILLKREERERERERVLLGERHSI